MDSIWLVFFMVCHNLHLVATISCCCEPSCMQLQESERCPLPVLPPTQPCPEPKCPPRDCAALECPQPPQTQSVACPPRRKCRKMKLTCPIINCVFPAPIPCPATPCPPCPAPVVCPECPPPPSSPPCPPADCPEPPPCPKMECPPAPPCPPLPVPKPCPPPPLPLACPEPPPSETCPPCPPAPSPPPCQPVDCTPPPSSECPPPPLPEPCPPPPPLEICPPCLLENFSIPSQSTGMKVEEPLPIQDSLTGSSCPYSTGCNNDLNSDAPYSDEIAALEDYKRRHRLLRFRLRQKATKAMSSRRVSRSVTSSIHESNGDWSCNSSHLKRIMDENLTDNITSSKRKIQGAAEVEMEGRFNVICSKSDFAYVSHSKLYCQVSNAHVTCYAFLATFH